jgi:DNA-binding MarR family transcriptional regulator
MAKKVKIDRPARRELDARIARALRELLPDFQVTAERGARTTPWDATFKIRSGRTTRRVLVEYKSVGEPRYLAQAITVLTLATRQASRSYSLIATPYIGPEGQRLCREAGVGYVDWTGNAFLRFDGILVDRRSGERPARAKARLRRLFSPKSSRIVRVLLNRPDDDWTLSRLATEAAVSVRTAYLVINALEEKAFVDKQRGAIRLAKPGPLLDLWVENYRLEQHRRRTFYSFIRSPRELATKLAAEAGAQRIRLALTLHAGAALVAPFVRYTDVHAYVAGDIDRFAKALDLRPVETGGGVHLLTPSDEEVFYGVQTIEDLPVVSNVQLYLDLLHYPARGREQAEELRRQKLGY